MFSLPWAWKKKNRGRDRPPVYKEKWKVYCMECEYFERKMNDWYYMNRIPFPQNPIPMDSRQSDWKWIDQCNSPENHKEIVTYHDTHAEREEIRRKNTRTASSINRDNDCHWFKKKEEDEPDWEK